MKVLIGGDKWDISILEEEVFEQRFGLHAGITLPETLCIVFNEDEINKETVVHELCHAWFSSSCTEAANLTVNQVEEVLCEIFAKHGSKILKQATFILKELV